MEPFDARKFLKQLHDFAKGKEFSATVEHLKRIVEEKEEIRKTLESCSTLLEVLDEEIKVRGKIEREVIETAKQQGEILNPNQLLISSNPYYYLVTRQKQNLSFFEIFDLKGNWVGTNEEYHTLDEKHFILGNFLISIVPSKMNETVFLQEPIYFGQGKIEVLSEGNLIVHQKMPIASFLYSWKRKRPLTPCFSSLQEDRERNLLQGEIVFTSNFMRKQKETECFTVLLSKEGDLKTPFCNLETGEFVSEEEIDYQNNFEVFRRNREKKLNAVSLEKERMEEAKQQRKEEIHKNFLSLLYKK